MLLHVIYASTSGHTEFVIDTLIAYAKANASNVVIEKQRVELATPEDLLRGDVLLLASGTWNTGGIEGQLNPHMHVLLKEKAVAVDLKGKKVVVIGLGDARYRYTAKARVHLEEYVKTHGGELLCESLRIVNEPYGQENIVEKWSGMLFKALHGNLKLKMYNDGNFKFLILNS